MIRIIETYGKDMSQSRFDLNVDTINVRAFSIAFAIA